MTKTLGLDVSYWQGPNIDYGPIDWDLLVLRNDVKFVFIRAVGYNIQQDANFQLNWEGSGATDILRGGYCAFYPTRSPEGQAEKLWELCSDAELPNVVDLERTEGMDKVSLRSRIRRFLNRYITVSGGKLPIIYTRKYWWKDYVYPASWEKDYDLWVASYFTQQPSMPPGWSKWVFWQDANNKSFIGIEDPTVDRDWFNGTYEELLEYATIPPPSQSLEERVENNEINIRILFDEARAHGWNI